jgi:hypothetical protein
VKDKLYIALVVGFMLLTFTLGAGPRPTSPTRPAATAAAPEPAPPRARKWAVAVYACDRCGARFYGPGVEVKGRAAPAPDEWARLTAAPESWHRCSYGSTADYEVLGKGRQIAIEFTWVNPLTNAPDNQPPQWFTEPTGDEWKRIREGQAAP